MDFSLDVRFEPIHELMASLHTYVCRKSHRKIDLGPSWASQTRDGIGSELSEWLDEVEIDGDWRYLFLLVEICPEPGGAEPFLQWLEGLTAGDLYERLSDFGNHFPANMNQFRSRTLKLISGWNEHYFRHIDPAIVAALRLEQQVRTERLGSMESAEFIDETTNGFLFKPMPGLERLVFIPQYHFQPISVINHFGSVTFCHYAARIGLEGEDVFPLPEFRILRCLGERSRLKILRYLYGGPRSFIEIVRHLGLSKGITHDHISKLRSAGLIHAIVEGETVTEYSLRLKAFQSVQTKLLDYIRKG